MEKLRVTTETPAACENSALQNSSWPETGASVPGTTPPHSVYTLSHVELHTEMLTEVPLIETNDVVVGEQIPHIIAERAAKHRVPFNSSCNRSVAPFIMPNARFCMLAEQHVALLYQQHDDIPAFWTGELGNINPEHVFAPCTNPTHSIAHSTAEMTVFLIPAKGGLMRGGRTWRGRLARGDGVHEGEMVTGPG